MKTPPGPESTPPSTRPLTCYVIEFLTFKDQDIRSVVWDAEVYSRPKVFDTAQAADVFAYAMLPRYPAFIAYSIKKVNLAHQ